MKIIMPSKKRLEALRSLTPRKAVKTWLAGEFSVYEVSALYEAIRKDARITLPDDELGDRLFGAMERRVSVDTCLAGLARARSKSRRRAARGR